MNSVESTNLVSVRAYLAALEAGTTGEALARFFTDDVQQIELPNKLNPRGGQSDLPTLLQRAAQGQQLLRSQCYDVRSEMAQGTRVAVEAVWSAELAVPLGTLTAGARMTAHFAMFFELSDGRIALQRNYDCFDPWE